MSGMFEETKVMKTRDSTISLGVLSTTLDRGQPFSVDYSYLAHKYVWQNGSLPDYTTPDYTLAPFILSPSKRNESWVGETVLYEADLQCRKAEIIETNQGFNISNGNDCSCHFLASENKPFEHPWNSLFLGHASANMPGSKMEGGRMVEDNYTLSSDRASCPHRPRFLAVWGDKAPSSTDFPPNWTAVFCEPTYWSQPVRATLDVSALTDTLTVTQIERLGNRTSFSNLDMQVFEDLAATGSTWAGPADQDSKGQTVSLGYLPPQYPDPDYQLEERFGEGVCFLLNRRSLSGLTLFNQSNSTLH